MGSRGCVKSGKGKRVANRGARDRIVTVNVGKRGLTENLINEINLQLEKRGVVKVKMLRSFRAGNDRRELARMIESRVRGEVVDLRGFVLTIKH